MGGTVGHEGAQHIGGVAGRSGHSSRKGLAHSRSGRWELPWATKGPAHSRSGRWEQLWFHRPGT